MPALLGFSFLLIDKISGSFDIYCAVAGLCSFFRHIWSFIGCIFYSFVILICEKENFYLCAYILLSFLSYWETYIERFGIVLRLFDSTSSFNEEGCLIQCEAGIPFPAIGISFF